ncbi:MAG TPA: phosphopantothenoylcysteine decarboxylase [Planctomycetaceae bacterium]|nr:phosphopantothenoylcysteine decarboxylase [Planctomycetaceae bacterium]
MRILITAGPTREYLDDVRYLSNASSGRMGYALARAADEAGHEVVLVSGPVDLAAPEGVRLVRIETTAQMLAACQTEFPQCDGVIGAAAVCDYTPKQRTAGKIGKTGSSLTLELVETPDVLGALGRMKRPDQWILGFALEADNGQQRALRKLKEKNCDAIVLNSPAAISAEASHVTLIDKTGQAVADWEGPKDDLARRIVNWIGTRSPTGRG